MILNSNKLLVLFSTEKYTKDYENLLTRAVNANVKL